MAWSKSDVSWELAVALDDLRMKGMSDQDAIANLHGRRGEFGPELVEALAGIKPESAKMEMRKVPASRLTTGMILHQEIRTHTGMLVVAKGQEITHALLIKLDNFSRAGTINEKSRPWFPVGLQSERRCSEHAQPIFFSSWATPRQRSPCRHRVVSPAARHRGWLGSLCEAAWDRNIRL